MGVLRRPRASLTLRLVLLLPLLATGVDVTRATLACGPDAETCLAAAGRGWMGTVAVALVPLYAALFGLLLARAARSAQRPGEPPPAFARLWLAGSAAMGAVTAGQMMLARAVGTDAPLGGSPLGVLALCLVAGAVVALALRAAHVATDLRPRAPRARLVAVAAVVAHPAPALAAPQPLAAPARGRGPPLG